jgi:hypothetical protein
MEYYLESLDAAAVPLGAAAAALLIAAAALHLYWAFGGKWGLAAALPTDGDRFVYRADPFGTGALAFILLLAGLILLGRVGLLGSTAPGPLYEWGAWIVAAAFMLRALGDFRYVGFTKKVWETRFARLDTFAYSPACLFVAFAAMATALSPPPGA